MNREEQTRRILLDIQSAVRHASDPQESELVIWRRTAEIAAERICILERMSGIKVATSVDEVLDAIGCDAPE